MVFDVVLIGGGISGLTSAALLSNAGLKVFVLERNSQLGGYLAKYEKNGFVFDTSIHWLNNCAEEGVVTKVFKLIGSDHPTTRPLKNIKRYAGDDFSYLLTNNPDELRDQLIKDFPEDTEGIIRFFAAARKIGQRLSDHHKLFRISATLSPWAKLKLIFTKLKFIIPFIRYVRYTGDSGKRNGLNLFFSSPKLHRVFSNEPDLLSCLISIAWAYEKDFQAPPDNGSYTYPAWLAEKIKSNGGKIITKAEAIKISEQNGKCKSVIYEHDRKVHEVFCDQIISTSDVRELYEKLMPDNYVPQKVLNRLKDAELYNSALVLYISLNCPAETLGFNDEIVDFEKVDVDDSLGFDAGRAISQISVFSQSARNKSLAPDGKGSLTVIMPAHFNSNNQWRTTVNEKGDILRGEEYKKLKKLYADKIIAQVEERLSIDIQSHIIDCNVATPITFWRYTKNHLGTMMGQKPGKKNSMLGISKYTTPLKGLYIGGHWAEMGGGVPIAVKAAVNTSLLVLKERKHNYFKVYSDYFDSL
jgi:phytoene dehydrogenase-like protein